MTKAVNNSFYSDYGERWYTAWDDPIALLRLENRVTLPWISARLPNKAKGLKVLDIGCGAGFLSNALAQQGQNVTAIDMSNTSLEVAARHDATHTVRYLTANAYTLPFSDESFDVVCAMDFLEHVDEPQRVIAEAARLLKQDGLFFFHTFNRNWLSYLLVIKAVEFFIKNTPRDMHVHRLFITPAELERYCEAVGLHVQEMQGIRPCLRGVPIKNLFSRTVPETMRFTTTASLKISYIGCAQRIGI